MRLTATLRGMHDRVSAQDDISKLTEAFLLLIRAILSYLARSAALANAPKPTIEPTQTPTAKPRHHSRRARTVRARTQATRSIRPGRRARQPHPPIHRETTQTQARTINRAPLLPDLPNTIA